MERIQYFDVCSNDFLISYFFQVYIGNPFVQWKFYVIIAENYYGIFANIALLIVSALEFICALVSSYKGSKALCPCVQQETIIYTGPVNNSHALVRSWLGKNSLPPHLYLVTSSSTVGKTTNVSSSVYTPLQKSIAAVTKSWTLSMKTDYINLCFFYSSREFRLGYTLKKNT